MQPLQPVENLPKATHPRHDESNIDRVVRFAEESAKRWKRDDEDFRAAHGRDWESYRELHLWLQRAGR